MSVTRRGIVIATTAALLAGGVFALPSLASGRTPVPAVNPPIVLRAHTVGSGSSRKGGPAKPGDTFWFTEGLKLTGMNVGTDYVSCTLVTKIVAECLGTWDFSVVNAGTIQVAGEYPLDDDATLAVVGATGSFLGDTGTLDISEDSATRSTETFTLVGLTKTNAASALS